MIFAQKPSSLFRKESFLLQSPLSILATFAKVPFSQNVTTFWQILQKAKQLFTTVLHCASEQIWKLHFAKCFSIFNKYLFLAKAVYCLNLKKSENCALSLPLDLNFCFEAKTFVISPLCKIAPPLADEWPWMLLCQDLNSSDFFTLFLMHEENSDYDINASENWRLVFVNSFELCQNHFISSKNKNIWDEIVLFWTFMSGQ